MNPSEEQLEVIKNIQAGHNVVVQAIPGAGKTTQILMLLDRCKKSKNVLILTYNRKLRLETQEKINKLMETKYMENTPTAHTFHSYCQNTYGVKCNTDKGIKKIIDENLESKEYCNYDLLIIDESQDMTELYFRMVKKIMKEDTQFLILGDPRQSIYGYNGADPRYLTLAHKLLKTPKEFKMMTLSTSYRMTKPVTDFLNNCIIGQDLIKPSPAKLEGWTKPKYIIINPFKYKKYIFNTIRKLLSKGYQKDDIFILAPSIKVTQASKSPIQKLANYLCKTRTCKCSKPDKFYCKCNICCSCSKERCSHNINIFIPSSDDSPIINEDVEGKVVFCTYHKAKGLERKIIIVLGFDMSYHTYFNREDSPEKCCNPLYVALTRSLDRLIIVQSGERLPFVNEIELNKYAKVVNINNYSPYIKKNLNQDYDIKLQPSTITQHMTNLSTFVEYITLVEKRSAKKLINLPIRHRQPDTVEIVCDITGHFINGLFEYEKNKYDETYKFEVFGKIEQVTGHKIIENYTQDIISNLLKRTNEWIAEKSKLNFKKLQIRSYTWIKPDQLNEIKNRIISTLPKNSKIEVPVFIRNRLIGGRLISINGMMDVVDHMNKIIWEIKCVNEINEAHLIQVALYKYINTINKDYDGWRHFIYNVKDDSILEIIISNDDLLDMIDKLIRHKYEQKLSLSNEEFLAKNI